MNVEVRVSDEFSRQAKKLIKKYPSLSSELQELEEELLKNPRMGVMIKENVFKIRLAVRSKGKGKSGGMRVITYIDIEIQASKEGLTVVYLVSIYDKSDTENISDSEIKNLIGDL